MTEIEVENIKQMAVMQAQLAQVILDVGELKKSIKELTDLKTKGMGAFSLASILFGTAIYLLVTWFKA